MNIIIFVLALLTAFGPLSIDMYLPALPEIARQFSVELSSVQLSLASFLIGLACGQIFYGPITDRFGRKKPLYFGLILYGVSSIFCASSGSVDGLILFRFMQALGSCAGMVISRAIVRDMYRPHEAARVFSLLMLIMGLAPILAPIIGGVITENFGWRSIFWVLATISLLTLVAVHFFLEETHASENVSGKTNVFKNYLEVLNDKNFIGHTLSMSLIYGGMFAYITGSAFVFITHYGLTPSQYSWVFGINAFGLIAFSQINGRLLRKNNPEAILKKVYPFAALAGIFLFVIGLFDGPLWGMCVGLFLFILNMGMIAPNAAASALAHQKKFAGSASALMGTLQFVIAAIISSLVSHFHDGTIRPMSFLIFGCGVLAYVIHWFHQLSLSTTSTIEHT